MSGAEYRLIFFLNCFRSLVATVSRVVEERGRLKLREENVPYVSERAYGDTDIDRAQTTRPFTLPYGEKPCHACFRA